MRHHALCHQKLYTQVLFEPPDAQLKACLGRILGQEPELEFGPSQPGSSIHSLTLGVTLWDTLRG